MPNPRGIWIGAKNLIPVSIYYAVRHSIAQTWLNDRDQFLTPNDNWKSDREFQNDCLAYTIFNTNIQFKEGSNHWIGFSEEEVNASGKFISNFMSDFIKGKIEYSLDLSSSDQLSFSKNSIKNKPLEFSIEAQNVFQSGLEIWKYYHKQYGIEDNASLYDIKLHF